MKKKHNSKKNRSLEEGDGLSPSQKEKNQEILPKEVNWIPH